MFVVQMRNGTFVRKGDGTNSFVRNPRDASKYYTAEAASRGKVGHHSDMGGSGFKGTVVPFSRVRWMVDHPRYREI